MNKRTAYYISILFTAIIIVAALVYLFQAYNVWAYLNPGADPIHYWNMDEMDNKHTVNNRRARPQSMIG